MLNIQRSMLGHITAFAQTLHQAGISVDTGRLIDFCHALELIGLEQPDTFYATARALMVSRQQDLALFDQVFKAYWSDHSAIPRVQQKTESDSIDGEPQLDGQATLIEQQEHDLEGSGDDKESTGYSAEELLMHRDIATLSEEELQQARQIIERLVALIASYQSRRQVSASRGQKLDFRRMLRRNLLRGKDATDISWRRPRIKKNRLLLLCDISGSMEAYSRFTLQFICALRQQLPEFEVAVFSTRTTVITSLLDRVGVAQSLQRVSEQVPDWSGGTNIGRCLRQFNDYFDRQMTRSKTVAIILSDGWDLGDATLMKQEMMHLKRRVHRLLWLNPLLGSEDYQPLCRGIQTALPYLDHFLPAHNLQSLAELTYRLRSIWR